MNRKILFRGKRVDNGEWIYGDLLCNWTEPQILSEEDGNEYEVIPETVGQFTGLTDKNGVKIFEGDVVFNSNKTLLTLPEDPRTYEIVWSEGQYDNENKWLSKKPSFSFRKIQPNNKRYMELIFNKSQIEVIGNIHDNPELIRKEVSNG